MGSRVAAPGHLASGHRLTFRGDANPVEVASQLLGDVGLPPGWQAHHHDHRGGVGQLRPTGCGGTDRGARDEDEAAYFLPFSRSSRTPPPDPPSHLAAPSCFHVTPPPQSTQDVQKDADPSLQPVGLSDPPM